MVAAFQLEDRLGTALRRDGQVRQAGLLVVTWEHGGKLLDSGFRADHPAEHENWVTAIEVLIKAHATVTVEHKEGA